MTEVDELFQKVPSDPEQVLERVAFLRQYLVEHPDSALAWAMLGATRSIHLDRGEELRCYELAHELEPDELGWLWGIARNTDCHADPSAALEVLRRLPSVPRMFDQFEDKFFYVHGAEFIPLLKRRVLLEPENALTWVELGWCLLRQGLEDEARTAFARAYQQLVEHWRNLYEPDDPGAFQWLIESFWHSYRLAWAYRQLGDTRSALQATRLALDAWSIVGWAPRTKERDLVGRLEEQNCHEEVAYYCEVAFKIETRYCSSFTGSYVWALIGLGKLDAALEFYRMRMDTEDVRYATLELAAGLWTAERLDEARAVLEEGKVEAPTAEGDIRPLRDLGPESWLELAKEREAWSNTAGAEAARERAAKALGEAKG